MAELFGHFILLRETQFQPQGAELIGPFADRDTAISYRKEYCADFGFKEEEVKVFFVVNPILGR